MTARRSEHLQGRKIELMRQTSLQQVMIAQSNETLFLTSFSFGPLMFLVQNVCSVFLMVDMKIVFFTNVFIGQLF